MVGFLPIPISRCLPILRGRRVLALDPGTHGLKLVLLESFLGRIRLLRQETIVLQDETFLHPEEAHTQLQATFSEWEHDQVALALPQHQALSLVLDLPSEGREEVQRAVEEETRKLSGLSESAIVYDYVRLKPFGQHRIPYWMTFCREEQISGQIRKFGLGYDNLCEVTSSSNALLAAYRICDPQADRTILVNIGATSTVVAIIIQGQGVYASSFPLGGDYFTEAIASEHGCALPEAESIKQNQLLLSRDARPTALSAAVGNWYHEFERLLHEWVKEHLDLEPSLARFHVVLSGGGAALQGLPAYLTELTGLQYSLWPDAPLRPHEPSGQFAIAYGTALQALGHNPQSATLLPETLRKTAAERHRLRQLQYLHWTTVLFLSLLLLVGSWLKLDLLQQKNALLVDGHAALSRARRADALAAQLAQDYENLRPIFFRQKQTYDALAALALLQQIRTNQNYWYVLFSDQESYFAHPPDAVTNGPPASTNLFLFSDGLARTNPAPAKYGFIAEMCLPSDGEAMRLTLSQIVTNLRQAPLFRNVDTLSTDRRRSLVSSNLIIPGRHFALTIELADHEFQHPLPGLDRLLPVTTRDGRSIPRTFRQVIDRPGTTPSARETK